MVLLLVLSACSVLAQAPSAPQGTPTPIALSPTAPPTVAPTPLPTTPTLAPSPTPAPDLPAVWTISSATNQLVAMDPQTGKRLNQLPREWAFGLTSAYGHWRYGLLTKQVENRWSVTLSILDLTRSANPTLVLLVSGISTPDPSGRTMPISHLKLSHDERRLFFMQAQRAGEQWMIHVYVVDVSRPWRATTVGDFQIVAGEATQDPLALSSVLSADDRRLWIVQALQRKPPAAQNEMTTWFTRVAILNLDTDLVERSVEVPGDVLAQGFWPSSILSPGGRLLYLLQQIVRGGNLAGYRFVAFEAQTLQMVTTHLVESTNPDEQFATYDLGMRLTPDGRSLVGYLGGSVPNRTGYFQFLDLQSGLIAQTIALPRTVQPTTAFNVSYVLPSPDYRFVYYADALTTEVFALDLAQRKFVRQAVLRDGTSTLFDPVQRIVHWLAGALVGTAHAKTIPWPGAVLSADGARLYLVSLNGEEQGDGVWAVETATLKSNGHWLGGKDILGIRLSADERELYAASPNDNTLYGLDALTGETRRTLKLDFKPTGFVTEQTY